MIKHALTDEKRRRAIESVRRFFAETMDDNEVGDLKAGLLLDFFLRELAPTVYNQAIVDAQAFFQEKVGEVDGSCYAQEFGYWK